MRTSTVSGTRTTTIGFAEEPWERLCICKGKDFVGLKLPGGASPGRLMRLSALCFLWSALSAAADLVERFDYSDGNLAAVSGGDWEIFPLGSFLRDAQLIDGVAYVGDQADVIRTFPAVLDAAGTEVAISFSVNIGSSIFSEGVVISFQPATLPLVEVGDLPDYGSSLGIGFLGKTPVFVPGATADILVLEGGGPQVDIGDIATDAWHTIRIDLTRNSAAPRTNYSLFLDDLLLRQGTFDITDPRGINSVEMNHATGGVLFRQGRMLIDEIQIITVPPPPVQLGIRRSSGFVILSWPADASGYTPESASSLEGPFGELGGVPERQGDRLVLPVEITRPNQFFRLNKP